MVSSTRSSTASGDIREALASVVGENTVHPEIVDAGHEAFLPIPTKPFTPPPELLAEASGETAE